MRPLLDPIMIALDASVDETSEAIPSAQLFAVSLQAVSTGTSTGTAKLQFSNDIVDPSVPNGAAPTNWSDIPSATVSVAGAGVVAIPKTDLCYQFIRIVYTADNAESGTISINIKALGA